MKVYYSVSDFQTMCFENKFKLDEDVLTRIKFLEDNLVIPPSDLSDGISTTNRSYERFGSNNNNNNDIRNRRLPVSSSSKRMHNGGNKHKDSSMDWETARIGFKTTKIETKEGVDKQINDIRSIMNKISPHNPLKMSISDYESQRSVFLDQIMALYKNTNNGEDECNIIAKSILEMASSNKYLSELYADIYADLVDRDELFRTILNGVIERYLETIQQIHYVDSDKDYDGFCNYNKINDARKAMVSFMVVLMKRNLLSSECIFDLIQELQTILTKYTESDNMTNEVDEITENICLMISKCKPFLSTNAKWQSSIVPYVSDFSKRKAKEYKSLSSRAVFKFMDLVTILSK